MKLIPVLFSPVMVEALMDNRKTMTRRLANVPNRNHYGTDIMNWALSQHPHLKDGKWEYDVQTEVDDYCTVELKCPYGEIGDVLWVKEAHYAYGYWIKNGHTTTGKQKWLFKDVTWKNHGNYLFLDKPPQIIQKGHSESIGWYKRSSLFMPKVACRTYLKITDIKVERAQEISEQDAIKEGIQPLLMSRAQLNSYGQLYRDYSKEPELFNVGCRAINSFKSLWFSINGEESWNDNPFVWCISFEPIDKPENFLL